MNLSEITETSRHVGRTFIGIECVRIEEVGSKILRNKPTWSDGDFHAKSSKFT